jgi:hypothetical protein
VAILSVILSVLILGVGAILLGYGSKGADIATIVALVVTLLTPVWGRALKSPDTSREATAAAAADLARRVRQEASTALRRALADDADAVAANVPFRKPLPETEAELVRWREDGGAADGSLVDIANYYTSLDRGRLVILGDPGSGKTVLAYHLANALAQHFLDRKDDLGAGVRVPVWGSLPSWDPGDAKRLNKISDEALIKEFDGWLVERIVSYGIPEAVATVLVQQDLVLPILDGLDEMDASKASRRPSFEDEDRSDRASAVIKVMNVFGRRPFVLTSRQQQYKELADTKAVGRAPVVQDAQQVIIQPLEVDQVAEYIDVRFHSTLLSTSVSEGWQKVVEALRKAPDGALAKTLGTPWRLFLALTAYREDQTDPSEMIGCGYDELSSRLLGQLIPATVEQFPPPENQNYKHNDVTAWLSDIAKEVQSGKSRSSYSQVDIRLEELWRIGGRMVLPLVRLLLFIVLGASFIAAYRYSPVAGKSESWGWLNILSVIVSAVVLLSWCWQLAEDGLFQCSRFDPSKYKQARVIRRMAVRFLVGLTAGFCYQVALFKLLSLFHSGKGTDSIKGILIVGAFTGWLLGSFLMINAASSPAAAFRRPSDVVRQGVRHDLTLALVLGLVVGAPVILVLCLWPRYVIGMYLSYRQGRLPAKPARFLDWAYDAGLLRLSGGAVQFRHRELLDWLGRR